MAYLFMICLVGGGALLTALSIRRFIAKQKRLGRWDDQGPLVETEPPPHGPYLTGIGMNERLEVIGEWHGKVLRDRRPESAQPDAPASPDDKQNPGERQRRGL